MTTKRRPTLEHASTHLVVAAKEKGTSKQNVQMARRFIWEHRILRALGMPFLAMPVPQGLAFSRARGLFEISTQMKAAFSRSTDWHSAH